MLFSFLNFCSHHRNFMFILIIFSTWFLIFILGWCKWTITIYSFLSSANSLLNKVWKYSWVILSTIYYNFIAILGGFKVFRAWSDAKLPPEYHRMINSIFYDFAGFRICWLNFLSFAEYDWSWFHSFNVTMELVILLYIFKNLVTNSSVNINFIIKTRITLDSLWTISRLENLINCKILVRNIDQRWCADCFSFLQTRCFNHIQSSILGHFGPDKRVNFRLTELGLEWRHERCHLEVWYELVFLLGLMLESIENLKCLPIV